MKVAKLCKTFANNLPPNIKLSKTQIFEIKQLGGFPGRLFGSLTKFGYH